MDSKQGIVYRQSLDTGTETRWHLAQKKSRNVFTGLKTYLLCLTCILFKIYIPKNFDTNNLI